MFGKISYTLFMEKLTAKFEQLNEAIRLIVIDEKKSNPAMQERYRRQKVDAARETPSGISAAQMHYEDLYKPSWHKAVSATIDKVRQTPQYTSVIAKVREILVANPNVENIVSIAVN